MKNLLYFGFLFASFSISAQNITIGELSVNQPLNTTPAGSSVMISTDFINTFSPSVTPFDCLYEFNYILNNGATPTNVTISETVNIPANTTSQFTGLAPTNFTFPNEGLTNITVLVSAVNCTTMLPAGGVANSVMFVTAFVTAIPTLSQWGIIILGMLIIVFGVVQSREKKLQFS